MTTPPLARDLVAAIEAAPGVSSVVEAMRDGRRVVASGAVGSSTALLAGAVARGLDRCVLLLVAHLDDADEAAEELASSGVACTRVPALEAVAGADAVASDLFAARLRLTRSLPGLRGAHVVIASIQSLMQSVPAPAKLEGVLLALARGQRIAPQAILNWLGNAGYRRVDAVEEPGDFSLRGGILDVFPPSPADPSQAGGEASPVRLDFFGDEIEKITEVDPETMGSDRALDSIELIAADLRLEETEKTSASAKGARGGGAGDDGVSIVSLLPAGFVAMIAETMEVVEQGRGYYERVTDPRGIFGPPAVLKLMESRAHAVCEVNQFSAGAAQADVRVDLPFRALPTFAREAAEAMKELVTLTREPPRPRVVVCCQNEGELQRLGELLAEQGEQARGEAIEGVVAYLHRGFQVHGALAPGSFSSLALVPYHELLSRFGTRRSARRVRAARTMDAFLDFDEGDYVVHADHGIARYAGLKLMTPRELPTAQRKMGVKQELEPEEFLVLEFASKAKLYVPATQIDKVQKYVGGFSGKPQLSVLGGQRWKTQKEKAAESVRDLAGELLRVRAAREHIPGVSFPNDTTWQKEFEAQFPYEETPDQLAALQEIKRDMHAHKPMDRLICGDVGFGKTELAIRGAFKACEFGKQVAVLVPTTVLAEQHERTFRSRFAGYPFRVESISRFKSDGQIREVLKDLRRGAVDLIIGTHRILSQDVVFNDLGLVIVDEEQRFGVEHKESLLRLRLTVDVMTLSATPIPRTLHMAMLGIRDISSLTTPPADRRAIVTEVIPFNAIRVRQAIERELSREGQVFVVHNKVHDIRSFADDILKLCPPDTRIVVGHGQMSPHELEDVMLKFIRHEADVLVSTTIIESGIDIANANTMIIHEADRFGLSDLHQLRGRVGRGKHRGYCYLLLPEDKSVKENAQKRLKALEQYSMLGAGFKIAMRDLEIRGAGNILGAEQSGHIALVGYEMFCRLLEDAVHDLRNDRPPPPASATTIEIGVSGLIPKAFIPSDKRRLAVYRRLAVASSHEELAKVLEDVRDAYGEPPGPMQRLFDLAQLRIALAGFQVRSLTIREKDLIFFTAMPQQLADELASRADTAGARQVSIRVLSPEVQGDLPMVYMRPPPSYFEHADSLVAILRRRLGIAPLPTSALPPEAQAAPGRLPSSAPPRGPSGPRPAAGNIVPHSRPPPPRGVRARPPRD